MRQKSCHSPGRSYLCSRRLHGSVFRNILILAGGRTNFKPLHLTLNVVPFFMKWIGYAYDECLASGRNQRILTRNQGQGRYSKWEANGYRTFFSGPQRKDEKNREMAVPCCLGTIQSTDYGVFPTSGSIV